MVVEPFAVQMEGFLDVRQGQLVEVLDQGGSNWLVLTVATAPGELEAEGFIPAHCLQPASKSESLHSQCQCRALQLLSSKTYS